MAKSDTVAKAFVNAGKEAKKAAGQVASDRDWETNHV